MDKQKKAKKSKAEKEKIFIRIMCLFLGILMVLGAGVATILQFLFN